jgi:transcriptional regulator with XRE-family HTH domain
MNFDEALGAEVRAARGRVRLRQVDLAERAGITQPRLSKIENGKESPTAATLVQIGLATGCEPASLLPSPIVYTQTGSQP